MSSETGPPASFRRVIASAALTLVLLFSACRLQAAPAPTIAQKFPDLYATLETDYVRGDVADIEAYGRSALRQRGAERLYGLWSVLYIYLDHAAYGTLRTWIAEVRELAKVEHDPALVNFADYFQFSLDQDGFRSRERAPADWSRFLDRSGPDIRLMALVEVIGHYVSAHQWSRAAESALAGLSESEARGTIALPVTAELHEQYANALSAMGYTAGAIDQVVLAIQTDRKLRLRGQDLARIYDLVNMAIDAGDLDAADHLARLHFRLAQTSKGPKPAFWTRYLCAAVAVARQEWARVLECTSDLPIDLAHPANVSEQILLGHRALARARLGDVAGARADLAIFSQPESSGILRDPATEQLIQIYLDRAAGKVDAAFEALDRRRIDDLRESAIAQRQAVSEVVAALDDELHRKRAESAALEDAVQTGQRLVYAWIVVAALLVLLILGGFGWAIYLRRVSSRLKRAGEQAQAASAAKSTFLAVMSHELRTPLNGLLGMAQVLADSPLTAQQRELVRTLKESGDALLAILNDVLDVSKIEAGHIRIAPELGDIRATCRSVIAVYAFAAQERGDRIEFTADPHVPERLTFDVLRVRQCLANLLSNAIKFTKDGIVEVHLTVELAAADRLRVKLRVADTGIGMTAETLEKLFGAFIQADASTTREYGGTGLGLNITLSLAKMMGGTVDVESRPGKGSVFTLSFLAQRAPATDEIGEPAHAAASQAVDRPRAAGSLDATDPADARRVLVVDDHPVNRMVARLILDKAGYEVAEAENGQTALERLIEARFDIVLMDINMPVMDGFEATRRIRAEARWAAVPIVALTADANAEDIEACLAAGMNAHSPKPINGPALVAMVARLTDPPPAARVAERALSA